MSFLIYSCFSLPLIICLVALVCLVRLFKGVCPPPARPTNLRRADAVLLFLGIVHAVAIEFINSGLLNLPDLQWSFSIDNDILSMTRYIYAGALIIAIFSAALILRDHYRAALLLLPLALVLVLVALQTTYHGAYQRSQGLFSKYIWFVTTLPASELLLDDHLPQAPVDFVAFPPSFQFNGRIYPISSIQLSTPANPAPSPAPSDILTGPRDTTRLYLGDNHTLRLTAGGQDLLLDVYTLPQRVTPGQIYHIAPSPQDINRRNQPLVAWIITHPNPPLIYPLINKAGSEWNLARQLQRIPDAYSKNIRTRLQEQILKNTTGSHSDALATLLSLHVKELTGQPLVAPSRAAESPNPFSRYRPPTYTAREALPLLVPALSPEEFSDLIAWFLDTAPKTVDASGIICEMLQMWLDSNTDANALRSLQSKLADVLIVRAQVRALSLLSGDKAAAYFDKVASISSNAAHPGQAQQIIFGAAMTGPHGIAFRAKHTNAILQALARARLNLARSSTLAPDAYRLALGPAEPGKHEPIRLLFSEQILRSDPLPTPRGPTPLYIRLAEIARLLADPSPDLYLQTLADPRFGKTRTWSETHNALASLFLKEQPRRSDVNAILDGSVRNAILQHDAQMALPLSRDAQINLMRHIGQALRDNPSAYGLADAGPAPSSFPDKNWSPHAAHPQTSPDTQWLHTLLTNKKLTDESRQAELAFALSTGIIPPTATQPFAAHNLPWVRKAAIDLIVRWPTPDNLALLTTLALDPDPAVSTYAKAGLAFIKKLQSAPLEKIPTPYTPEALTFFNL